MRPPGAGRRSARPSPRPGAGPPRTGGGPAPAPAARGPWSGSPRGGPGARRSGASSRLPSHGARGSPRVGPAVQKAGLAVGDDGADAPLRSRRPGWPGWGSSTACPASVARSCPAEIMQRAPVIMDCGGIESSLAKECGALLPPRAPITDARVPRRIHRWPFDAGRSLRYGQSMPCALAAVGPMMPPLLATSGRPGSSSVSSRTTSRGGSRSRVRCAD